ncbi:biotin--[acetyl-CoA-carboxylase] ligase [Rhizobium sp. KVB221]|uniref:biotin--[biotin carboxyl-carrier protein] ligase n=1 Tax=Rhizobium setariae TaxID=2801340 RepID=A0A936YUH6_9HYPH|nr:biotin--[acetyl-CoA-carboxylase] ligase [Rhizobium setariae]MBL0372840.1 biotin--[acetyl-CoA-carboxylase] ligase [Rhizobium setariae]
MAMGRGRYGVDNFRHQALGDVSSTNTVCMELARAGDPGNVWVTARRQLGGRGRRGRAWISEAGNLYASLLLIDPAPLSAIGSLPIAVALALYRAIADEMPWAGERIRIKWPNDVLIDAAKVSGILIEAENLPDGRYAVVIGCGVNIAHKPENPLYPAATLNSEGASSSADSLFAHLLQEMAIVLEEWDEGRGVSRVVDDWKHHVKGIGSQITVNFSDRSLSGIFSAIEDDGRLVLTLPSGEVMHIASGDVFFS